MSDLGYLGGNVQMYYGREEPIYRSQYNQHGGPGYSRSNSGFARSQSGYGGSGLPVLELKVPMCCEKCQEKVREELEELEGVRDVVCDQYNQRVTVTGYVDPIRALKKVKKVKKHSEFFAEGTFINGTGRQGGIINSREIGETRYTGHPLVRTNSFGRSSPSYVGGALTRSNSYGRGLSRMSSFGRASRYEGNRYDDFEPTNIDRDFYGVRRMPSFNRHRHHDAEYIAMDNQYTPYYGDTQYVSRYNQRPVYRSQPSYNDLPFQESYYY